MFQRGRNRQEVKEKAVRLTGAMVNEETIKDKADKAKIEAAKTEVSMCEVQLFASSPH